MYTNKKTDQPTLEEIAGLYLDPYELVRLLHRMDEVAGLYLFNPKERAKYLECVATSKDKLLTLGQQRTKRSTAVKKLRNVIEKRMPITEKLVLETNKQATVDRIYQEKIQFIEKALSISTPEQREDYYVLLANATDPKTPLTQQRSSAKSAIDKLRLIVAKQIEKEKQAAMTTEELSMYDKDPERVAANAHTARIQKEADVRRKEKEAALRLARDPDALARQAAQNEANRKWMAAAKQAEEEKRANMTPEELEDYENDPERVAAKAEKTRLHNEASAKYDKKDAALRLAGDPDALARQAAKKEVDNKRTEKEATLCRAGDTDALARRTARNEAKRERYAAKRQEMLAEIAELFRQHGGVSTVFGEGGERQESIMRKVKEIMRNYAGVASLIGEITSKKWLDDHGDVSVEEKLAEGEWAAYILITRTGIIPGKEEECDETKLFLTRVERDPLLRIELENGDLKRMSPPQANSVVHSYLLAECDTAYDVTSLEAACQFYLEDEIGLPHGMCLHKQAGAGKRLENSMTKAELKLFLSGELKGWSLVLSIIRVTDCVFAAVDPFDPTRSPPLVSASVLTLDGTDAGYRIRVRGNKQSFPDTPSVVADRATNKATREKTKARRQNLKRGAAGSVDSTESPEEMEEETAKKRKIGVVEGGE
jgi:hypothetical protein